MSAPPNTTEASTFAIDGQVYGEDLSGVAEIPAYLLPGNDARRPAHILSMNRFMSMICLA